MLELLESLRNAVGHAERFRIEQVLADVKEDVADTASTVRRGSDQRVGDEADHFKIGR